MGKVNTYERKGAVSSEDVEIVNGEAKLDIPAAIKGADPLPAMEIATDRMYAQADISHEAFMAQEMEIFMMDAPTEDEAQFAEITVNGDYKLCRRGENVTLKRYHVAVLANAKELRLKQTRIVNADGSMGFEERMVSKLTYPFSVIHDPAGRKGADWMRQQLQQAR